MAVFILRCPHCNVEQMTFPIFGVKPPRPGRWRAEFTYAVGACGCCERPVSVALDFPDTHNNSETTFAARAGSLIKAEGHIDTLGFRVQSSWPKPVLPEAPDSLPAIVEKAFIQAEKNRLMKDCEEAAATMYRRSLDLALKESFPEERGTIDAKLKRLVQSKMLPEAIGKWANEVRIIGNDGAHDIEGVEAADLLDARAFIDTVLKYLFTLPAQIEARRIDAHSG